MSEDKKPGYIVNLTCGLDNGKQISLSFNFDEQATTRDMNDQLDRLMLVLDRQRAQVQICKEEIEIMQTESQIDALTTEINKLEQVANARKPNPQERMALNGHKTNIDQYRRNLGLRQRSLDTLKKLVA